MNNVKKAFSQLDDDLASCLMEVLQFGLNDVRACKRVAKELDLPVDKVDTLVGLAIGISTGGPVFTTMNDLDKKANELSKLKAESMN
ncbi:hypothetical protein [Moritella sp. F3]|uniref:hypothetical protein n=1 Tax=Moritella sp. F3 TaxID=2718882 RepID=UPI0018E1BBA9|nr:hypothetical protein [Moritella sp. F3]GIC77129.1 hypothetical protein FMO001_18560 [Moritella sp. F1]GIC82248.1 hypothetical protein FMO003_25290 [Moritella sp. F3]